MAPSRIPSIRQFLIASLYIAVVSGVVPRFGAFDHDQFLAHETPAVGAAHNYYAEEDSIPAFPALPFSPNLLDRGLLLDPRLSNLCEAGNHSCYETTKPNKCCPNDRYCYLDRNWEPQCCSLGIQCKESLCGPDHIYCNTTSTKTVTFDPHINTTPAPTTLTTTNTEGSIITFTTVHSIETYITSAGCCNRPCSTSSFQCEREFGEQCCPYGFKCGSSSVCISDPTPTPCATTLCNGTCCGTNEVCASQGCTALMRSNSSSGNGGGLSTGATAGIGIGVGLTAVLIIVIATWFFLRRRRSRGGIQRSYMGNGGGGGGNAPITDDMSYVGVGGRQHDGGGDGDAGESLVRGPRSSWMHTGPLSDASEPMDSGLARIYLGPEAVVGPYTEYLDENDHLHDGRGSGDGVVSPVGRGPSAGESWGGGVGGGDPMMPYRPDHIRIPVEIGGAETIGDAELEDGQLVRIKETSASAPPRDGARVASGVFELVGSVPEQTLLDADEAKSPTQGAEKVSK